MNKTPLVSIVLPVCNASKFLGSCLESLCNQTYKNIEIIAIDDNSKDTSWKILRECKKNDSRLRFSRNKKRYGLTISLNRALRLTKGQYVAFMDPHDTCGLLRIRKQLSYFLSHPKIVVVGTQCFFINRNGKRVGKSIFPSDNHAIYRHLFLGLSMKFDSIMVNKKLLPKDILRFPYHSLTFSSMKEAFPFTKQLIYTDMLLKLLPYGKFANLPDYLYHSRNRLHVSFEIVKNIPSLLKFLVKSVTIYDYRPSIRTLFTPLIEQI